MRVIDNIPKNMPKYITFYPDLEMMPIPCLNNKYLPAGIHDCNFLELKTTFGNNNCRRELIDKLNEYISKVKQVGIKGWLIINGSFVTSKDNPNDIDVVLIIKGNYPLSSNITQEEYEIISPNIVKRNYKIHLFIRINGNPNSNDMIEFFSGVREDPNFKKGILRIAL